MTSAASEAKSQKPPSRIRFMDSANRSVISFDARQRGAAVTDTRHSARECNMAKPPFSIVESSSAARRLDRGSEFLHRFPAHQPITIVAATRGAADDLARRVAARRGATIGLTRVSLTQLAARVAASRLAGEGIAPTTALGVEAVASRVAFDAAEDAALDYFGAVARTPGFPRALARTLTDVRLADMPAATLAAAGRAGHDLAELVTRAEAELTDAATADRTVLF